MKKIILSICFLLMIQFLINSCAIADEIIDSQGNIIPCKIETVGDGFVEYHKNGRLCSFAREENSPVFNDYVDVRNSLLKKDSIQRIPGKIIVKDMWGVIVQTDNERINIPFFRVKFVGVYKP